LKNLEQIYAKGRFWDGPNKAAFYESRGSAGDSWSISSIAEVEEEQPSANVTSDLNSQRRASVERSRSTNGKEDRW
jgi:hypothetical protein